MNYSLITVRYAKALFQLAADEKSSAEVLKDVGVLLDTVQKSEEFSSFLENPLLKVSDKLKVIDTLFKEHIDPLSLRFLHLLVRNKREVFLKEICLQVLRLYRHEEGTHEAVITTAQSLDNDHRQLILDYITKKFRKKVELSEKVDPAIIGGFVLRIADQQINASLKSQLQKIQRELINS